jgi:hypothetical protein
VAWDSRCLLSLAPYDESSPPLVYRWPGMVCSSELGLGCRVNRALTAARALYFLGWNAGLAGLRRLAQPLRKAMRP